MFVYIYLAVLYLCDTSQAYFYDFIFNSHSTYHHPLTQRLMITVLHSKGTE